jgi:hypothetical protein
MHRIATYLVTGKKYVFFILFFERSSRYQKAAPKFPRNLFTGTKGERLDFIQKKLIFSLSCRFLVSKNFKIPTLKHGTKTHQF